MSLENQSVNVEIFERILFFAISVKNSPVGHDLTTSVNDSDFATLQGFYFHEIVKFVKIKPSLKFTNLQYSYSKQKPQTSLRISPV